jgi:small subunit ribosomal protein S17
MAETRRPRKTLIGSIVGNKMDKTVVVSVERLTKHSVYGKYIKRRVKYVAHDEKNECGAGDKVALIETRPLSKMKRWRVKEILEKAK